MAREEIASRHALREPDRRHAIRSEHRRMMDLSPAVPRVILPTVFSANGLTPIGALKPIPGGSRDGAADRLE